MSFDPIGFFNLSNELYRGNSSYVSSDSNNNQALLRTLVSRIYYSILLQIAEKYNINATGISDSHNVIIKKLAQINRNALNNMKALRIKADYDLKKIVGINDIDEQFELYNYTINKI